MVRTFLPSLLMLPVIAAGHYGVSHVIDNNLLRLVCGSLLGVALMGMMSIPVFKILRQK
jgi:hypothetical protein